VSDTDVCRERAELSPASRSPGAASERVDVGGEEVAVDALGVDNVAVLLDERIQRRKGTYRRLSVEHQRARERGEQLARSRQG
jgi:hypothetical protein